MKIGVFGTGIVGRTIAAKLASLEHEVLIGTREPAQTLARPDADAMGNAPFSEWAAQNPAVRLATYQEAAAHGEILWTCTNGTGTISALEQAGEANLNGKVLLDITNALDFSKGFPPSLFIANTDSLGELIQRSFPELKVVKTLQTMSAHLMVNPAALPGDHDVFVGGNDADAKAQVTTILRDWFGWQSVVDLGDITTARSTEALMHIWLTLYGKFQSPDFNFKIVR